MGRVAGLGSRGRPASVHSVRHRRQELIAGQALHELDPGARGLTPGAGSLPLTGAAGYML